MNREIKFRAWDGEKIVYCYEHYLGEAFLKKHPIMQFTELYDKNGKEIYEGDILERIGSKDIFMHLDGYSVEDTITKTKEVVELKVNSNEFGETYFGYSLNTQRTYSERIKPATYEIIGNIYENPELLNQ